MCYCAKIMRLTVSFLLPLLLASCDAVSGLIHDGEAVARVGKHVLYRTGLDALMPSGLDAADSAEYSRRIINEWAADQLFMDMADTQLSKEEKDVTDELEVYRRSLLRYRYEQRYVNERLDTAVTMSEIEAYYESHPDMFKLDVPILKVRYLDIMQDSPNREVLRKKLSSEDYRDAELVDSLAYASAIKYLDSSEKWIDAVTLAREFDTDYATMLSRQKDSYIEMPQELGDVKIAYVIDYQRGGVTAPLDYCEDRIKNIILSSRKHAILSTLEQDLLEDAVAKEKLEIIESDK